MAEIILPPEEDNEITPPDLPELNIDKPTENSKVITIEFEAKKTNKVSTKDTNQQLYTTDTDAWFKFKETSLENANGTYSVVFRNRHDGSIFQRTGDVVDGVAYYKIPHQEIRHAGAWLGQLVYTLENGNTTAQEFGYDVKGHMLDGKDVREIVVEDFETLMSQLRSMKESAEVELADLAQKLRSTTDTAEQNETDRQAFFDELVEDINEFEENERQRQTNEQGRESAESERVSNEEERELNEAERISKDSERDSKIEAVDERLKENEEDLAQHKLDYVEEISEKANKQQEEWITPTILNGWVDALGTSIYPPTGFMKDEFGFVHIKGHMHRGEGNDMFILPEDYRPPHNMFFAIVNNHTGIIYLNGLVIYRDGRVSVQSMAHPLRPSLNVSFRAVES